MFRRNSFSPRSFKLRSWRFPQQETPWEEPGIQPGAFAPLSRPSSPITRPFKRRTRRARELDLLIL